MPPDAPPRLRDLIEACWNGEPTQRPAFKRIVRQLDDVLLDATIDDEAGAEFWRQNFATTELRSSVPWREFAAVLLASVAASGEDEPMSPLAVVGQLTDRELNAAARECSYLQPLVATTETQTAKGEVIVATMERFCKSIKWFGRYFVPGAQSILDEIKLLQTKNWFHGDISKEEAEARLSCRMEGTFLVRLSATTPGCPFTISMINNQHRVSLSYLNWNLFF